MRGLDDGPFSYSHGNCFCCGFLSPVAYTVHIFNCNKVSAAAGVYVSDMCRRRSNNGRIIIVVFNLKRFISTTPIFTYPPYPSRSLGALVTSAHFVLQGRRTLVSWILSFAVCRRVAAHSVSPAIPCLIGPLVLLVLSPTQFPPKLCDFGNQCCVGWLSAVGDSA